MPDGNLTFERERTITAAAASKAASEIGGQPEAHSISETLFDKVTLSNALRCGLNFAPDLDFMRVSDRIKHVLFPPLQSNLKMAQRDYGEKTPLPACTQL